MSSIGIPIENISPVMVHKDEWRRNRLGKFTASLVGTLIGKESNIGKFTDGAITYIQNIAGEIITGKPWQKEFMTDATEWGNAHELEAIQWFSQMSGFSFFRNQDNSTHRLIVNDEYSGCTPDALIIPNADKLFSKDGSRLLAYPLEVKCPPTFHVFIKLFSCDTPQQLKEENKTYYWQHICQILFCNSYVRGGKFGVYHPDFKKKGKIIEFRPEQIKEDLIFLNDTLTHATKKLIETVNYLS